jgi:predicted kinase
MNGGPDQPQQRARFLVLVTGPPGTGKSTVAEAIAELLGSAVLGHDWAMSGLRPYPELQEVLDGMEPSGHRVVGWSIVGALARAQLRGGRSVVLDGVARSAEIDACREIARSESAPMVLIATLCSDPVTHRTRIEGRTRHIPHWYELDWDHVERSADAWEKPDDADLYFDAADSWESSHAALRALFASMASRR